MRAVLVTRFGGTDVLCPAEVERPSPISTEVLVRVVAAGVNPVDCKTRRGDGVARWVGPPPQYGVTRFKVGDLVFGMPRFPRLAGAYAEFVAAPSLQFARAPEGVSPIEAASLPLAALTAWQCLVDAAQIGEGQTVLVHGAGGGVGHLAVQIAKARGAHVVATTGRSDRDALQARNVDVALDLVGGRDTAALIGTVRQGGILLAVADGADDGVKVDAKACGVRVEEPLVEPDGRTLEEIARLVSSGDLKVAVSETFPLEQAAAAHDRLERGGVKGKLVLEVGHD